MELENLLEQMPEFDPIVNSIKPGNRQLITGISGSARTLLLSALKKTSTASANYCHRYTVSYGSGSDGFNEPIT
ncbi:hypothetical protein [Paucilactobacillus hokkaidonensis]|uniref:hypothetical protein n=1 Tax=Paucilactobacillus hokkaidonensis TaxID=1193095 RepID=UPI003F7019CA